MRVLLLFSGGMDSTVLLYSALSQEKTVRCLLVDYGQSHKVELDKAKETCENLGVGYSRVQCTPLPEGGITTGKQSREFKDLPHSYTPGRNSVLISLAIPEAIHHGCNQIWHGANKDDYSGYPDCRSEFFNRWNDLLVVEFRDKLEVRAPLVHKTKAEIVTLSTELGIPLNATHSCYSPISSEPCGECDACLLRQKATSHV